MREMTDRGGFLGAPDASTVIIILGSEFVGTHGAAGIRCSAACSTFRLNLLP